MTFQQKEIKKRDKILFKHYTYRGGAEYIDIVTAMEEYAEYKCQLLKQKLDHERQHPIS